MAISYRAADDLCFTSIQTLTSSSKSIISRRCSYLWLLVLEEPHPIVNVVDGVTLISNQDAHI